MQPGKLLKRGNMALSGRNQATVLIGHVVTRVSMQTGGRTVGPKAKVTYGQIQRAKPCQYIAGFIALPFKFQLKKKLLTAVQKGK